MRRWFTKRASALGTKQQAKRLVPEVVEDDREVLWLDGVNKRLLVGDVTLLTGNQGLGKSLLIAHMAAGLSTGAATGTPEASIILTSEDRAHVVKQRVEFAGGDWEQVTVMAKRADGRRFRIPTDLVALEAAIRERNAKLVVIDPVMSFLADGVHGTLASHVRDRVMTPLQELAERTGTTIILVVHTSRGRREQSEVQKVGGSKAFTEAARSVLRFGVLESEENNPDQWRLLLHVKSNLGPLCPTEVYELIVAADGSTARLEPRGPALEVTTLSPPTARVTPALDEAVEFLHEALVDGPMTATEVKALASDAGISERSLKRAKTQLGITSRRRSVGFAAGGDWYWELPAEQQVGPPPQVVPPLWVE